MPNVDNIFELHQFFDALRRSRESALLLDYDETLSLFQLDRAEAVPYPGVPFLLTEILNMGHTRIVVIAGRPAQEIIPLLGILPHPEIWGANGLQRMREGGPCELPRLDEVTTRALAEADSWLNELGIHHLAEHKPGGLAVHWRGLSHGRQSEIHQSVLLGWTPVVQRTRMVLQEFDCGVEIRMPDRNKGDAVRSILLEMDKEAPVAYLGDDESDEDAFRVLRERGLGVLVRPQWHDTFAHLWLESPADLLAFLCNWLEVCVEAQRPPVLGGYTRVESCRGLSLESNRSSVVFR